MNYKQLLLLCLPYKCLRDETQAITESFSVVPVSWLSLGWLTALPVTSLFQWMGPTLVLAEPQWPLICYRMYPEEVLSIPTFHWWQHFFEISIPSRRQLRMIGICIFCCIVTVFILSSHLGVPEGSLISGERRNLILMSLFQDDVPGAEKVFDSATCPSTSKAQHNITSLAHI